MTDQSPPQHERDNRMFALEAACRVATPQEDPSDTIFRAQKYYEFLSGLVSVQPTPIRTPEDAIRDALGTAP